MTAGSLSSCSRRPSTARAVTAAASGRNPTGMESVFPLRRRARRRRPGCGHRGGDGVEQVAALSVDTALQEIAQPVVEGVAEQEADGVGLLVQRGSQRSGRGRVPVGGRVDRGCEQAGVLAQDVADQDLAEPGRARAARC